MIDLHTHILPGVDDGADDLETALAMGRFAQEEGITAVAATPHFHAVLHWGQVKAKVRELQSHFAQAQIGVELVAGAELLLDPSLLDLASPEIPTYGDQGKYCLLELPMHQVPLYTDEVLFHFQAQGLTPIIAHPERYSPVIQDPNTILTWLERGCLVQLNAGSLLGRFGSHVQAVAEILLTHNMVQVVASDAHGFNRRRLNLPLAYPRLVELVGEEQARELVDSNPRFILAGREPVRREPREYRKKRRFFIFGPRF